MRSRQTSGSWHVRGLHVVDSAAGFGTRTAPIGRCTDRPQVVVNFVIRLHEDSLLLATSVYVNWRASGKRNEKKEEIHKNGCDHVWQQTDEIKMIGRKGLNLVPCLWCVLHQLYSSFVQHKLFLFGQQTIQFQLYTKCVHLNWNFKIVNSKMFSRGYTWLLCNSTCIINVISLFPRSAEQSSMHWLLYSIPSMQIDSVKQ